jgi:hypothetical protein
MPKARCPSKSSNRLANLQISPRFGTEGSVACPAVASAKADSNPLAPTTSDQANRPSIDGHRRLKAFFVGDSEITPRESLKSLGIAPDLGSVMAGGRRSSTPDYLKRAVERDRTGATTARRRLRTVRQQGEHRSAPGSRAQRPVAEGPVRETAVGQIDAGPASQDAGPLSSLPREDPRWRFTAGVWSTRHWRDG